MNIWPFSRSAAIEQKSGTSIPEDWLNELLTGAPAGSISASTALTVPAVASAIRVISEAAATLDIRILHKDENGKETDDTDHPVYSLLNSAANDWTSGFDLIRDLVSEALTQDAGGFAWVNRVNGRPYEILKYDPGLIGVQYSPYGTGEPTYRINGRVINPADVIHVRGAFTRCPLTLAREAITVAWVMESHASNLFRNGARPGGVIETPKPVGDEGVKKMLLGWRAAMEGAAKTGKTAALYDNATFRQMTLNSVDAQFQELRVFQNLEIARAFRVPPSMIFELDRATWSNSEQMGFEFLTYTLEPWLHALEGALSRALFTRDERQSYRIMFDRDDLTRASLTERSTAISSLIGSKVLNPNEARSWIDLPPYEGGDDFANPHINTEQPVSSNFGKNPKEPANGPE